MDEVNSPEVETEEVIETTEPEVDETPSGDDILSTLTDTEAEPEETKESDETSEADDTEDEAEPEADAEAKEEEEPETLDPKEEARRRYNERQAVIAERKARVAEQTQDYIDSAPDENEQRIRAIEARDYERIIEHNENTLISEFDRVKVNPDLQIFNPDSDQFNSKAYDKALRDYNAGYLGYDANGNLVEIKGSLYQHLNETAELLQGAVKSGQVQQVRATRKMKTNSDSKPAAEPKESKKDDILDVLKSD